MTSDSITEQAARAPKHDYGETIDDYNPAPRARDAAEHLLEFVSGWGDGIVDTSDFRRRVWSCHTRDIEAVCRAVLALTNEAPATEDEAAEVDPEVEAAPTCRVWFRHDPKFRCAVCGWSTEAVSR